MIEVRNLTKRYSSSTAVNALSFTAPDGAVTGFLGPNGSGKSTTMRMIVGLETPNEGEALIDGSAFRSLDQPARVVGALLTPEWIAPHMTGRGHLKMVADYAGVPESRADEALEAFGLAEAAKREVKNYSLGMRQRLGAASALIADPSNVILDEPVNGLDPQGVAWMRGRIREMAAEGRAVVVSSHLMSEMQLTADRLVVINRGRLAGEGPLEDFLGSNRVEATCSDPARLAEAVGGQVIGDSVVVDDATARDVGEAAQRSGVTVYSLQESRRSLEEVFLESTK
ncbi:ATP-binding cassette domain-containing protein [Corynebacterium sp. zg912]|uniref:ATP-binding cassette domain-containing protein n=1 Tax=Corynebacterium wankanglinii TaxID=2735136 RepID=A0A7V8UUY6_9CORY|nr:MULTISPECIES: ATP-binding cassette domain-containing protein [Corynebacterium]MBA1837826.1 ATP-binding cassette domain-containing protein [Corynebacterium wankanglinii]MCR5929069.1 ATP-binding cassette domain-containing protein [Corynebacterium sp. zg912]